MQNLLFLDTSLLLGVSVLLKIIQQSPGLLEYRVCLEFPICVLQGFFIIVLQVVQPLYVHVFII